MASTSVSFAFKAETSVWRSTFAWCDLRQTLGQEGIRSMTFVTGTEQVIVFARRVGDGLRGLLTQVLDFGIGLEARGLDLRLSDEGLDGDIV